MTTSVGEDFPVQQARVRELIEIYQQYPAGIFAVMMMKQSLARAEQAAINGDIVEIIKAYEDLKSYQE